MAIRPPSLRAIAAFEAAARLGSFARAAEELHLTHSAVSHAVRTLEERLGTSLFERGKNVVTLTQDGTTLASRVRLSLDLLSEAFDLAPTTSRSKLVVSALGSVANRILVPRLPEFFALRPDVEVELQATRRLADIKGGEADVAIRFGRGQWPGLSSKLLSKDTVFPVAAPHYRGGALPRTTAELAEADLIIHPAISWRVWLDGSGAPEAPRRGQLATDDSLLMIKAAIVGCGVALVNGTLVRDDLAEGRLVKLFDLEVDDDYAHWAVWDGGSPRLSNIVQFVDWLASCFDGRRSDAEHA